MKSTLYIGPPARWSSALKASLMHSAAYLLIAGTFVSGLPVNTISQDGETVENAVAESVRLEAKATDKASKMRFASYSELQAYKKDQPETTEKLQTAGGEKTAYDVASVEFKTIAARRAVFSDLKKSTIKGVHAYTAFNRFADVFIENDVAFEELAKNAGVARVEYTRNVIAPPPPDAKPSGVQKLSPPEPIIKGGRAGLTGKGVTIAILDTGIDFRHPDFIKYDAQGRPSSRIKYIWDTATPYQVGRGSKSPVLFPNGGSIGTLYSQVQLTAELRAATQTIPATDIDGHGTACAGIAAGNGNADNKLPTGMQRNEVVGVAPDADIIGVRFGYEGFENIYTLTAAAEWLDRISGKAPLILSGSFGGHWSGHDGQTIRERQLNTRFPLTRAGRAILFAAGNDGDSSMHATMKFDSTAKTLRWNAAGPATLLMYFDRPDALEVGGGPTTPLAGRLFNEINGLTGQRQAELRIGAGQGSMHFKNPSGKPVEAHFYIVGGRAAFLGPERTFSHLVGNPGGTENAITVGSYDWNDEFFQPNVPQLAPCLGTDGRQLVVKVGWLSCYSSPGPNRSGSLGKKGATKPEIVAPGQYFRSPNARENGKTPNAYADVDPTGYYRLMNGTSAATPYTAGIVALMLQKKRLLTLGQVKELLVSKASKTSLNPASTVLPNKDWGYGKLDLAAVDSILAAL